MVALALLAALVSLTFSTGLLESYEGEAVAFRPLPGSDGQDDPVKRFVLEHDDGSWSEVTLPSAAFSGVDLPFSRHGVPLPKPPEESVPVLKSMGSWEIQIGDQGWSDLGPADVLFSLGWAFVIFVAFNMATAGRAMSPIPDPEAEKRLAKKRKQAAQKSPSRKGPPPPRRRRGPPPRKGRRR